MDRIRKLGRWIESQKDEQKAKKMDVKLERWIAS